MKTSCNFFLGEFLDGLLVQTLGRGLFQSSFHAVEEGVVFSENDNNGNVSQLSMREIAPHRSLGNARLREAFRSKAK